MDNVKVRAGEDNIKVTFTCKDCPKSHTFTLAPSECLDWTYKLLDEGGFTFSDDHAYCDACGEKYKRDWAGRLTDELKEVP